MSRWRLLLVAVLLAAPLAALAVVGSVALWREQLWRYAWWPLFVCMALGYYLAWHWHRRRKLLPAPEVAPESHWTERDRQAWKLVEARAEAAAKLPPAADRSEVAYATGLHIRYQAGLVQACWSEGMVTTGSGPPAVGADLAAAMQPGATPAEVAWRLGAPAFGFDASFTKAGHEPHADRTGMTVSSH